MVQPKAHVCPADGRRFKTAAALRQHRDAAHGRGSRALSLPARRSRRPNTRAASGTATTHGSDVVATFGVSPTDRTGKVLFAKRLSPESFPGTRFRVEALLWSRWKPARLVFRFACGGPTTGGGTLVIGWNPDPDYKLKSGSLLAVNAAMASQSNVIVRLDTIGSFAVPVQTTARWLLTDLGAEISAHGTIFAVLVSSPAGVRGKVEVTVSLDWTVEWNGAELSETAVTPADTSITPDDGYFPCFTTSDGSFDGTILTFKAHSGGGMIPWSHAAPGMVYKPAEGTKVPYVDSNGTTSDAKWFSLVLNYQTRGLVLHASEQDARDYQRTGRLDYCLKYKAAGSWATPNRPVLVEVPEVKLEPERTLASGSANLEERLGRLEEMFSKLASSGFEVLGS